MSSKVAAAALLLTFSPIWAQAQVSPVQIGSDIPKEWHNNAAIAPADDTLFGPEEEARGIFDANFFGTLRLATAFAPVLAAHDGGTLVNVLSSSVWVSLPTAYAASKAAA